MPSSLATSPLLSSLTSTWSSAASSASPPRQTVLVMRHAHRHPVVDILRHEDARLTERGHAEARALGADLGEVLRKAVAVDATVDFVTSTVERCIETARALREGVALGCTRFDVDDDLASPFIRDRVGAYTRAGPLGPTFLRRWFDGAFPTQLIDDRATAAQAQWQAVLRAGTSSRASLVVVVTHDWNIALVKEDLLGLRHEDHGWPHYLDGYLVNVDDIHAEVIAGEARKSFALAGPARPPSPAKSGSSAP